MWERLQLAHHLSEIALHQGFHLRTVHGDVVVELWVGPDDRVDLAHGSTGVGLYDVDVGRRTGWSRADHHRGRSVTEDHPGRPDAPDLVRELLGADEEDRALHLLEQPHHLCQAVG